MKCIKLLLNLNIWCGILINEIIGPYFSEGTLTPGMYKAFLQNELPYLLKEISLNQLQNAWFQHDGAPPHYALIVRARLTDMSLNRWI
ncbi:hypothetical protein WN55_09463 [Dufourea novaeangliae]|uniref:Histone-lysine N-methyltransferase SETMAR n=1 Tax=Dufourea novaeangliae TaxID=178035 RepID=A0A154PTC5_DUFNO|nr:hypothetical protein WN55_09463 [Dufourea novaeangliae]